MIWNQSLSVWNTISVVPNFSSIKGNIKKVSKGMKLQKYREEKYKLFQKQRYRKVVEFDRQRLRHEIDKKMIEN